MGSIDWTIENRQLISCVFSNMFYFIYLGTILRFSSHKIKYFQVYGHENVSIMDGGLSKWKELQFETETSNGQPKSEENGNFQAKWVPEYIASTDDLVNVFEKSQKNVPKYSIVDTRSPKEFGGEKDKPESKYGGSFLRFLKN